ncbi:MAG: dockerin type I repeat-containing protein [Oscillospiraceae bacterium]|nr:dockerin type I repeat-containing protein [Oscillospiraceae bacterium]
MKKLKRIFSFLTAAATLLTSAVTVSAEITDLTEDTSAEYSEAEVYGVNDVVFDDGEDVIIFDDYIHLTHSRYDFKMSYVMLHNDGIVTPEWFDLSNDYVLEQTGYDDTTETYTVTVETQEELDSLYNASAELLEKGIIENAYKQFEYTYNYTDCGEGFITLKEEDPDFDLSFAEGLENIILQSYSSDPEMYSLICSDLNDVAALERSEETIKANENVAEFGMAYNYCTVVLPPTVLRTYLISEQELPETTAPTEQPTEAVTTTSMETTTADNKVDVSLIENITGEEVIYTDGNYICLSGGEGQRVIGCYYRMAYMIERTDSIITPEYFGLSDDYEFVANFPTADDEEFDVYTVAVESQEELDRLYEESVELLEKGIIKNAYKQYEYEYGCSPYGSSYAYYILKDENSEFDFNAIEGLEDFEVVQSENNPQKYIIEYTDAFEYIKLKEATDIIEANENIEEYSILYSSCCALHIAIKKDEYLIEESETEETTNPTEQPTESVTTTPSEVPDSTEEVIFDANGDQKFNIRDCSYIAMMLAAGKVKELPETADYNKDGKVNVRDEAGMAKYLVSTVKKPIPNPNSSL